MTTPQPRNPDYAARVRDSFGRQAFMATIGADLTDVAPGHVEMRLPYRPELGQQHGFFHGGVIGTLADNAGGYAAFTLMSPEDSILTVEYKMNIVSPGRGDALVAVGTVLKPGRTLTVCEVKVYAETAGDRKLCATAICTLMTMKDMSDDKAE
ncbi:PaaI family thioesterase [Pacificispira sp.]|uniref:PaaI family thioesterase n=1 Tax=Pacificispira sp. TaxID=2888761 RepID=UPI003BAB6B2F